MATRLQSHGPECGEEDKVHGSEVAFGVDKSRHARDFKIQLIGNHFGHAERNSVRTDSGCYGGGFHIHGTGSICMRQLGFLLCSAATAMKVTSVPSPPES